MARQLGLTPAAVSKWETGQALPDIMVLGPLAAALGTTTDDLLGYDPDVDEARAEKVLGPAREAGARGDAAEAARLAGEALAAYPASTTVAFAAASAPMGAAQAAADPGEARCALARSSRGEGGRRRAPARRPGGGRPNEGGAMKASAGWPPSTPGGRGAPGRRSRRARRQRQWQWRPRPAPPRKSSSSARSSRPSRASRPRPPSPARQSWCRRGSR
ncbi:helix-turn-helix domain-containing protein [Thermophilibacter mediterraneus]|uniref:helix-turn-helix domain-containing protein n=1 Tax=Thermophilibacter mediterraneus TaxID=1871031 RepID=UPI0030B81A72